ncbi:MAG: Coq4 family protein [Luminiphilus sp.]|nr:Coq4 family protein [Luminiphilus sp.]
MNRLKRVFLRKRIKPIAALLAIKKLLRDPDDTSQVFKIIDALSGDVIGQTVKRLLDDGSGRELLASKPNIVTLLNDREQLSAMPVGSVGHTYYQFVHGQNLSADGLVASSEGSRNNQGFSANERWTGDRLRDIHDLQHVMTGYGRDPIGELSLLSFMTTQVPNRGINFIIKMAKRKYQQEIAALDIDALVLEGKNLAQQAAWMPAIHWEERLTESLENVRAELGFVTPTKYQNSKMNHPEWFSAT